MNSLVLTKIGRVPGMRGVVLLNGEDVSNQTFKVEIGVTEIKLFRFKDPMETDADGNPVEVITLIDELKVN